MVTGTAIAHRERLEIRRPTARIEVAGQAVGLLEVAEGRLISTRCGLDDAERDEHADVEVRISAAVAPHPVERGPEQ